MKSSQKLVLELKKLNSKLDSINTQSRFMVYSANPVKFAWFNFIGGVFHSLGSLFGTMVIAAAFVYLASRLNVQSLFNQLIENTINQIKIENIIPTPTNNALQEEP